MDTAKIKLNSLPYSDRPRAKNQNLLFACCLFYLIDTSKTRIIVRSFCCKLCCTGIHHFISWCNFELSAHIFDFFCACPWKLCNHMVWKLQSFCLSQQFFGQRLIFQSLLHLYQNSQLVNKPPVNHSIFMNHFIRNPSAQSLCNHPDSPVIYPF